MVKSLVLWAAVACLLPACAVNRKSRAPAAAPIPAGHSVYAGDLPCPDECKRVRTVLTLIDEGRRFVMKETFTNMGGGQEVVESRGEWTILKGHERNPNAVVLELTSESFDQERYFLRLGSDGLRVLDSQGREFLTKENSVLMRQYNP